MEQWYLLLRSNFYELDSSSQEIIYYKFREFIYQDIYFLFRSHNLSEDVVQESFLKVINKAPGLKDTRNMKAWMKTVARNTAYDFLKKNKKYHHISDSNLVMVMEVASTGTDVADQVEEQIRDEVLHEALNQLNKKYRDVLFLYYIENMPHKEIAKELGISEQATAQLLVRARKKLVHYFSRKWVDEDG